MPPSDQTEADQDMTAVRDQLGESVFRQEYLAGQGMTLDDAIAFALN